MIYVDTSVALAHLLAEDRCPPASLWEQPLVTSRLTTYEIWTRINARGLHRSHGELVRALTLRLAFVELSPLILGRALEPFPMPVRTLDAIHLASMLFLREAGQTVQLASYDDRLLTAARKIGIQIATLS